MNNGIILQHVTQSRGGKCYPMLSLTVPIHCSYALKHNFDYQVTFGDILEKDECYSKIKLLLDNVEKYEYLIWFDSDVMVIDDSFDLRNVFKNDLNAVIYKKPVTHYNAGIFYFKGNVKVKNFLTDLISRPTRDKWYEQRIFNDMVAEEKYKEMISAIDITYNSSRSESALENPVVMSWHSTMPQEQKLIHMVREARKRNLLYI